MLVLTAAMLFAGCGGSSDAPTRSPDTVELLDGTSPQNMSSGRVADYRPTGRLIADSGFRPARDGFGFENYDAVGQYRVSENGKPVEFGQGLIRIRRSG